MYIPKYFEVTDEKIIFDFIEAYSFGTIVSIHGGTLTSTHLPFLLEREKKCLTSHFARANEQWEDIAGQEVLVIFQGPHHYISPSWYETSLSVPTWNYVAVHVYGTVELMENREDVLDSLHKMTEKYENSTEPYRIDSTNQEFVERLMQGITGFRINISRLQGKWKLSQNHSKERQQGVAAELEKINSSDACHIAQLMWKNVKNKKNFQGD